MHFALFIISIVLCPSISEPNLDHSDITVDQNYIDKIEIVNLILESYSAISERRDDPVHIGLYHRFENQTIFDEIRCRNLDWGVAYCDLFNVVRYYNKMRFLTTRWFDFEDNATIQLMEVPNFDRVEIYFHFSPIAINYDGNKALVMVRIDEGENKSSGLIIGLEKNNTWEIELKYTLDESALSSKN
jgi:hypothetical protein